MRILDAHTSYSTADIYSKFCGRSQSSSQILLSLDRGNVGSGNEIGAPHSRK